ncbi:S8 family serine peptidase [Pontibacter silvestris]|uniref:S8 family serine peptidase n=1 Tax=Pontibacter silvestris TaxID=2305183 RepID=A0ABW4X0J7_9BACT|nr:S8 family serine peptidase [Pontibacter silvestris]MCC9136095.1 S8 family serine peptidase [Pontibacter silvestris]
MKLYRLGLIVLVLGLQCLQAYAQDNTRLRLMDDTSRLPVKINTHLLKKDANSYQKSYKKEHRKAKRFALKNGYPIKKSDAKGKVTELQGFYKTGKPKYYTTYSSSEGSTITISAADAASTTSTDQLWQGGSLGLELDGSSSAVSGKLGIWDGSSVRATHRELTGRVTQQDRVTVTSLEDQDHPTHVAGIMIGAGVNARAKGMAYNSNLKAWDWNSDISEATTAAAAGMLLSNHSYGLGYVGWVYNSDRTGSIKWEWHGDTDIDAYEDYRFGYYDDEARQIDRLAYNAPGYLMVVAAGNDRTESGPTDGSSYYLGFTNRTSTVARRKQEDYDLLTGNGVAKNVLTIGAVSAIVGGYQTTTDVESAYFSNWGPTDDGRIKPDLVGDGVNVFSSVATSDDAYASYSGTSMAAPNVTGSLLLLQEHYAKLNEGSFMRASTLKGLAIHTADEAGNAPGPDYSFGWGLLNTARAASVVTNSDKTNLMTERIINQGESYTATVVASGTGPIVATLSWTDPEATPLNIDDEVVNNRTPSLVNDLDLQISDSDNTWLPWVLNPAQPKSAASTGDNTIDNVEQVLIRNPVAGKTYELTVKHKGTLTNSSQVYSLILSGIGGGTYCVSSPNSDQGARITKVTLGEINSSITDNVCTTYSDFTDQQATLVVGSSTAYPLSVSLGTCSSNADKLVKVFIDWNNDFDFDDADELVATSGVIAGNGTFTANVVVPANINVNTFTRMRIVCTETDDADDVKACGAYENGETQDYSIKVIDPVTDAGPVSLVLPDSSTCAGPQTVKVKIRNYGSSSITNIKVTAVVIQASQELATLSGTYTNTLETKQEAELSLEGTFTATAGETYIVLLTTELANDQVAGNNTYTTSVTIAPQTVAPEAQAYSCNASNINLYANGAGTAYWYDSATGGNLVAAGNNTSTSTMPANETYYVAFNEFTGSLGPTAKTAFGGGSYGGGYVPMPLITTDVPLELDSARLYIGYPGKLTFTVETANDSIIASATIDVQATRTEPSATDAVDDVNDTGAMYPLNLKIPEAGNYHIRMTYQDGATIFRSNVNVSGFPFTIPNIISLTGALYDGDTLTSAYYYLYDLKVKALDCPSERVAVTAQPVDEVQATISAGSATTFCEGDAVELSVAELPGVTYQWQKDGVPVNGADQPVFTATQSGNYTVLVSNGICEFRASNAVEVTASVLTKPTITVQDTTLLTSSSSTGNQWLLNGATIADATASTLIATRAGYYAVSVTQNGCSVTSDSVYIFVEEPEVIRSLTLYPNPAPANYVIVDYTSPSSLDKISGAIYDIIGHKVRSLNMELNSRGQYSSEVKLSGLAPGVYIVRLEDEHHVFTEKFVKLN